MKKILGVIVAIVLMMVPFTTVYGQSALAQERNVDGADAYFLEFVSSDTTFDGEIDYYYNPLYNETLNVNGREYIFTVGNVSGYALMVEFYGNGTVFYEIEELFYNKQSPFADCNGLPVYITHNVYLEYKNQAFYDVDSDTLVDSDTVAELVYKGFKYFGDQLPDYTHTSITIDYATKSTQTYSIQYDLPDLEGGTNTSCANTAGAVIFTYYDRFYENLIPNYVPYITIGNGIRYKNTSAETWYLVEELAELMLIGEPHAGTTFSEFQLGMSTYATNHGYTYSSTDVFSNGSFNFNNYKTSVENNKPVAIFLTNFSMLNSINEGDGQDSISSGYCAVSHVAVGCGYRVDTYYNANNNVIDTRTYLKVASGLIGYGVGYLNINGVSTISKAISTQVS